MDLSVANERPTTSPMAVTGGRMGTLSAPKVDGVSVLVPLLLESVDLIKVSFFML